MSYNCLVIDDEPLARKVIEKHLEAYPQFKLEGSCENALSAFELCTTKKIDLLFLDIQMPGIDGLQFIRTLKQPPAVVFTTAYSEHAAESYELDAVDYLLKPVSEARFARCIARFLKQAGPEQGVEEKTSIFLKIDGSLVKVLFGEILYIESRKDYLMIFTGERSLLAHMTMKNMEELLPADRFMRIHRSFIIAIDKVRFVGANQVGVGQKNIPLGENYRKKVGEYFKYKL